MNSTEATEKSLIPALFQIASRADDIQSIRALKQALASSRTPLAEMMMDARRLEGILKTLGKKRKAMRQIRLAKKLSPEGGATA